MAPTTSKEKAQYQGVGLSTVFLCIFLVLKLTGLINWSWVWVLSPIWIVVALVLLIFAVVFLPYVILDTVWLVKRRAVSASEVADRVRRSFEEGCRPSQ